MKFTLEWLKDHLKTDATADEIVTALTTVGLEVESVEDQAKALKGFTVAHVVSAVQHPNADKLRVLMVDFGGAAPLQVVCGAPNARAGIKGVFAPAGTYIPGSDFTLSVGNIRGQDSNGMMCSGRELLISDDHSGIIELPDDAPIGTDFAKYRGLDGVVIDISITPNRGDCTGVYGIARDLAAAGLGDLKDGTVKEVKGTAGPTSVPIEIRFEGDNPACPMFAGRLIKGVKNGPSPQWLQDRLRAVGLRPINTLVDVTNFISMDRGRPLHVYDADKLTGTLHARMGKSGESLVALDGKTYPIDETMCVIADDRAVLGLGGIMGGEETGCTDETKNVLIESAWFDPLSIAQTGRKTGIVSDARYRFERTVDPEFVRSGLELATRMVLDLCGGEACEPRIAGQVHGPDTIIEFPLSETERLTGLKVPLNEVKAILSRLGFWLSGQGEVVKVAVPSWRPDVTQKADIVEEIMRMVGVDKVPVTPLPRLSGVAEPILTPIQNRRRIARRSLAARGLDEAVTWSFIPAAEAERFGGGTPALKLANPIASDLTDMRPSLLPGLLAAVRRNQNRGLADLGLFEVGQIFLSDTPEGQHTYASGVRTGTRTLVGAGRHWQSKAEKVGVFDAKADLAAALDALGIDIEGAQVVAEPAPWAHPGRGGRVQLGPKLILGWFGELHPAFVEAADITGPVAAFEIDLDALPTPKKKGGKTKPALILSDLMAVTRDFAFVLDRDVPAAQVLKAARAADKGLITAARVFDLFEGAAIGEGKKSLAIEVTLQPRERTLTDEEIDKVAANIVAAVAKATGGQLRA